jgi:hypothetical protein
MLLIIERKAPSIPQVLGDRYVKKKQIAKGVS